MATILACIDGSAYDNSVCDHALWLAGPIDATIEVLCIPTRAEEAGEFASHALGRLVDHGAIGPRLCAAEGGLVQSAAASKADLVVMGKRGRGSLPGGTGVGSHVAPMLEGWGGPVCLASHVFLPPAKALVLLDTDLDHRAAIDFVSGEPALRGLSLDIGIVATDVETAAPKERLVRERLAGRDPSVLTLQANGLTDALLSYMEARRADVFVISRAVLLPDAEARLRRLEACGLWSWRTPVLVC